MIGLKDQRNKLIADARALYTVADSEQRALRADEEASFDKLMADAEAMKGQIARLDVLTSLEAEQSASRGRIIPADGTRANVDANEALRAWLLLGTDKPLTASQLSAAQAAGMTGRTFTFDLRSDALRSLADARDWSTRAQATSPGSAGGYLVAPEFHRELEIALLAGGGMRSVASVIRTDTGANMPWPTSNDAIEGEIIGENQPVNEADMVFGSRTLHAFKYSSRLIRVSVELLADSAVNLAEVVGTALGERIARITNRHFTTGIGTTEPFGVATDATVGVTAASAVAITYDEIVNLVHSVDPAYRANASFMFHDNVLLALRKLRDENDELIWQPGLVASEPNTILGYKYTINQSMPTGTGSKAVLFGDFSRYRIRDVASVSLQRLDERYAEYGQVGFLAFSRHDGALIDAGGGAIKALKMA